MWMRIINSLKDLALVDACDVILINCYPFWEGANNDHALQIYETNVCVNKSDS